MDENNGVLNATIYDLDMSSICFYYVCFYVLISC